MRNETSSQLWTYNETKLFYELL